MAGHATQSVYCAVESLTSKVLNCPDSSRGILRRVTFKLYAGNSEYMDVNNNICFRIRCTTFMYPANVRLFLNIHTINGNIV